MKVEAKYVSKDTGDYGYEGGEEVDAVDEKVINIVDAHRLVKIEDKMTGKVPLISQLC